MSAVVTVTCDRCRATKPHKPVGAPWWDFMYSSMDFPVPGSTNTEFKSGSWDLCPHCSVIARDALVAAIGSAPDRDDFE